MPKIAYVCDAFPPDVGGGELANSRLTAALRDIGNAVTVLTRSNAYAGRERSVLRLREARLKHMRLIRPIALISALRRENAEIIISVGPSITSVFAAIAAKLLRRPFIYFYFGDIDWSSSYGKAFRLIFRTLIAPLVNAAVVYAPTLVQSLSSLGIPTAKIRVTSLGCDVRHVPSPRRNRSNYIIFVGGLGKAHEYKRPDLAIDALSIFPDRHLVLHLVGGGDPSELLALAKSRGVQDRVVFHGVLSEQAKRELVAGSRALVLPSPTRREGFGLVVLEAMRMGVPAVVGGGAGCAWIVESSGFGKTCAEATPEALAAALQDVLSFSELQISEGYRKFLPISQVFTWESMARDIGSLCSAVINERNTWFEHDLT